jgi:hypothetical protein
MNDNILSTSADLLDILRMDALMQVPTLDAPPEVVAASEVASETVSTPETVSTHTADHTVSPVETPESLATPVVSPDDESADEVEVNMDDYMARFEKIQTRSESEKQLISKLLEHKHAGGPLMSMVIDVVISLHAQNEELYSLLVDMNNLFGK